MPVIKQTTAVKGVSSNYRITTLDGQTPKPFPLWKYTWILPEGVDAEFKSVNTGFPMVIVQWNQTSQPGSPFRLKCEVQTDAEDCFGVNCVVDAIINVSVGEEIVNLNTDIWGATGACIKVGDNTQDTDVTYYANCYGAKNIIWNVVNGKIRIPPDGDLIYSPYSTLTDSQGNSSITVNWLDGSTHNISAYGVDISGNASPQSIYPTYPAPSINAQIDGLSAKTVGEGDALFNFTVNNIKSFNPSFNVIYNIYVGRYNTTGPINNDLSYNWELKVLTDNGLEVQDIMTNVYTKQYTMIDPNMSERWGIKFKPQIISNTDVTCRSETTIVKYFNWEIGTFEPTFADTPEADRDVTYLPVFVFEPSRLYNVNYTPTFIFQPFGINSTGNYYSPIFPTGPLKVRDVTYTPTFSYGPTGRISVEYVPIFPTGPVKSKIISYEPVFVTGPFGYEQPEYSPTFVNYPTGGLYVQYIPRFTTGPTNSKIVEYVPIFVTGPFGYEQPEYSPTFTYYPTGTKITQYSPLFPTGPLKTKVVEFTPVFINTPIGYEQSPYSPTFVNSATGNRSVNFVPIFTTPPVKMRVVEYVPVFTGTPAGSENVT